jgi:hypothetical protein
MDVDGQLHATAAIIPLETGPGIHWIGGWVGLRAYLETVEKRKISCFFRE